MKLALVLASVLLGAACVSDRPQAPLYATSWTPTPYRIDMSVPAPDLYVPMPDLYVPAPDLYVPAPDLMVPGFAFD